jgi:uncharacterized protein
VPQSLDSTEVNLNRRALVIMAKLPRPGAVKTRLGGVLTDTESAELYTAFLDDKVDSVCAVDGALPVLAFTPEEAAGWFAARYGSRIRLLAQRGGHLGERLASTASDLFAEGFSAVVLVDSDTPNLPRAYFSRALSALADGADAVLGPTCDGGYYLLGTTRFRPELFRDIHWSTPLVAGQTLAIAHQRRLSVRVLPSWYDIDTPADLDRLASDLRSAGLEPGFPRHTVQVLGRMISRSAGGTSLGR